MGQGRHTLRSVSDPVYPLKNLKKKFCSTLSGLYNASVFVICTSTD